jgi:anti-sigma28 factor (negative regulator of flagellin synthesis)
MVQMRCSVTSELLMAGTPLEVATAAADFSATDILFDDVGGVKRDGTSVFDPAAVRAARAAEIASLQAQAAALSPTKDAAALAALQARIKALQDAIDNGKAQVATAKSALTAARARIAAAAARA